MDSDVGVCSDLLGEVARHRFLEATTSYDHVDRTVPVGEVECGLTGGVPRAHDGDFRGDAESRLGGRRGVEDAHPFELLQPVERQPAVASAHRHDDGPGLNAGSVIEVEHMMAFALRQRNCLTRSNQLRPELLGLNRGASRQLLTRDARRKPQVVLDPGRRTGLAPDGQPVNDKGA
jgi:hypothetical protein